MSIRVIVADDQEIVRTGLRMILNAQPDIEVVGEAADGLRAVELARRLRPDVCLFDIRMPGTNGIEATRSLAGPAVEDPLAVVVITTFDLDEYVYAALKAAPAGSCSRTLVRACSARSSTPPRPATRSSRRASPAGCSTRSPTPRRPAPAAQPVEPLTDREEQALAAVARGRTNGEIADELHITLSTVKTHVTSLMTKLGARNRVETAIWAYETNRVRNGTAAEPRPAESTAPRSAVRPVRLRPFYR